MGASDELQWLKRRFRAHQSECVGDLRSWNAPLPNFHFLWFSLCFDQNRERKSWSIIRSLRRFLCLPVKFDSLCIWSLTLRQFPPDAASLSIKLTLNKLWKFFLVDLMKNKTQIFTIWEAKNAGAVEERTAKTSEHFGCLQLFPHFCDFVPRPHVKSQNFLLVCV